MLKTNSTELFQRFHCYRNINSIAIVNSKESRDIDVNAENRASSIGRARKASERGKYKLPFSFDRLLNVVMKK